MQNPSSPNGITLTRRGHRLTLLALGSGALTFFWLSLEDNGVSTATLLGVWLAALIVALSALNRLGGRRYHWRQAIPGGMLLGGLAGLLAGPLTAALMILKSAQHAHLVPDYPLPVVGAALARTPAWGLAGALIGLGAALLWFARQRDVIA